jgi:purine-binding chemotaxis protein CheW
MTDTTTMEDVARPRSAGDKEPESTAKGDAQLLCFNLAGRDFGLDVENVIEIIRQVEVTDMPDAPECIEGIINIRETVVPLVNMYRLLGVGDKAHDINTQIIVVYGINGIVGLMVDNVSDIVTVRRKHIMRPSRSTTMLSEFVRGVVDLRGGLMLVLDIEKLVDHERWGELSVHTPPSDGKSENDATTRREKLVLRQRALELSRKNVDEGSRKRRLITFSLGDEIYGVDVIKIKEVSDAVDIYFIPSAPEQISGVINLRGVVVPVIDLASILGLHRQSAAADSSIIVVERNNITLGLLADEIGDIVEVAAESIEAPLSTIERDKAACLEGGVEWDGKLLGILKLERIVQLNVER